MAVIGDVHGRADLLARALEDSRGIPTVCVGDYIDRGPQSADVLAMLRARPDVTCLAGNHEDMLLAFLDAPEQAGPTWLRHGGEATVESFGLNGDLARGGPLADLRDALAAAMGEDLIGWLRDLPVLHINGNVAVVHAAADPAKPLDQQDRRTLLWGHPGFARGRRRDGMWVVHGHTVVAQPSLANGRIAVDTGAYATNRLTVAHIGAGKIHFSTATFP